MSNKVDQATGIAPSTSSIQIGPRAEVEVMLVAYSKPGHVISYEDYLEVFAMIRDVCPDPNACNACTLMVFACLDADDLPSGIGKEQAIECAVDARGNSGDMRARFEDMCRQRQKEDTDFAAYYTVEEMERGLHLTHQSTGQLRTEPLEFDDDDNIGPDDDDGGTDIAYLLSPPGHISLNIDGGDDTPSKLSAAVDDALRPEVEDAGTGSSPGNEEAGNSDG